MSDDVENNEIGGAWTLPVMPSQPEALPRIADTDIDRLKSEIGGAALILISDLTAKLTSAQKVLALTGDTPFVVGSSDNADLSVDHESVSAEHCELALVNGQWVVTNLALLQGSWVNDQRIRSHKLVNRDIIRSGCLEFMFLT